MSADLLAEFGQGSSSAQASGSRPQTTQSQTDSLFFGPNQTNDDFFKAIPSKSPNDGHLSSQWGPSNNHYSTRVSQQQAFGFQTFDLPRQQDSEVLFDATAGTPASEEEDDWGEFEGPEGTAQQSTSQQTEPVRLHAGVSAFQHHTAPQVAGATSSFDLLSLDDTTSAPIQGLEKSQGIAQQAVNALPESTWEDDSFDDWGEFTEGQPPATAPALPAKPAKPANEVQQSTKPAPPQPTWEDDSFEEWDDFTDDPSAPPAPAPSQPKSRPSPKPTSQTSPSTSTPPIRNFISPTTVSPPTVRPTNIPPPSVLLDLLVTLLNNLQKEALTAKRTPPSPPTSTATATPAKIHNTLTTAAYIIAGRTLRWKRDTILSQAMRIGPAHAGKPGGMKLLSVNKHEDVKEEQDAVDVVTLWRERAALFNAVIQGAGLRAIPPVSDPGALKVVTARLEQGALKAGHACALCALRRDERVLRVDEGVEDSFGEWWTEHWGHTGCRVFWERNSRLLGQR